MLLKTLPWILTIWGVLGLYLAGRKLAIGWLSGVILQTVWILYAILSHQYAFIFAALCYGVVFARNYVAWLKQGGAS